MMAHQWYGAVHCRRLGPVLLAILMLAGCAMPPDITPPPKLDPLPPIQKDARLSDREALPSSILEVAGHARERHHVDLLAKGDDAWLARVHLIRAARRSIDIQTFIYKYDESGLWIYNELLAAARRGVKVRVLVDHVVSPGISANRYAAMASAHVNMEIRLFRPISANALLDGIGAAQSAIFRFNSMNYRMHNKVMTIDNQVSIIGGRNFQNAYFDRDSRLCFRDRDVIVTGPILRDVHKSFEEFWGHQDSIDALRMNDLRKVLTSTMTPMPEHLQGQLPETFHQLDELANMGDIASARPDLRLI